MFLDNTVHSHYIDTNADEISFHHSKPLLPSTNTKSILPKPIMEPLETQPLIEDSTIIPQLKYSRRMTTQQQNLHNSALRSSSNKKSQRTFKIKTQMKSNRFK